MSNFDTKFIKFLTLLLVLGLMSGLTACENKSSNTTSLKAPTKAAAIIGGENASADFQMATKVIYLALGAEKKITPFGITVSQIGLCTASAIAPRILLTAAHCVQQWKAENLQAVLTLNPWNHPLNTAEWISVEKVKIHEGFINNVDDVANDLALLKLSADIPLERISMIIEARQVPPDDFSLLAIGYGQTTALKSPSPDQDSEAAHSIKLQASLLNYVMKKVENFEPSSPEFAIDQGDMKGLCHGDSGGPGYLFDPAKNEYYMLGVTSYVSIFSDEQSQRDPNNQYNTCIGRGHYTNLLLFRDWIEKNKAELLR